MIYNDTVDIPQEFWECFEYDSVNKIQSRITNNVELFKDVGISVSEVTDSGTLFLMINLLCQI